MLIERTLDVLLCKLKGELELSCGVSVHVSKIYHTLLRHRFTLKKNVFVVKECVEENRIRYMINISQNYHPDQLVFVDESAMN